jgi:hypothetical protein
MEVKEMIIAKNDNWYSPIIDIDKYMNLFCYFEWDFIFYYTNFGYQNMFITLEIRNKMYKEEY